eukprot:482756-Pelagomonas_calceolata.AAC.2
MGHAQRAHRIYCDETAHLTPAAVAWQRPTHCKAAVVKGVQQMDTATSDVQQMDSQLQWPGGPAHTQQQLSK